MYDFFKATGVGKWLLCYWNLILFLDHLNDLEWKISKLKGGRSHRGLQLSYKISYSTPYKEYMIFLRQPELARDY